MRKGEFEYCGEESGLPVFRLRWRTEEDRSADHAGLTREETNRALFVRYLIRVGRIGEGWDSSLTL